MYKALFNFLLEEMGERIDDLEKHVADLMTEAGIENTDEELKVKTLSFTLFYVFPLSFELWAAPSMKILFTYLSYVHLLGF